MSQGGAKAKRVPKCEVTCGREVQWTHFHEVSRKSLFGAGVGPQQCNKTSLLWLTKLFGTKLIKIDELTDHTTVMNVMLFVDHASDIASSSPEVAVPPFLLFHETATSIEFSGRWVARNGEYILTKDTDNRWQLNKGAVCNNYSHVSNLVDAAIRDSFRIFDMKSEGQAEAAVYCILDKFFSLKVCDRDPPLEVDTKNGRRWHVHDRSKIKHRDLGEKQLVLSLKGNLAYISPRLKKKYPHVFVNCVASGGLNNARASVDILDDSLAGASVNDNHVVSEAAAAPHPMSFLSEDARASVEGQDLPVGISVDDLLPGLAAKSNSNVCVLEGTGVQAAHDLALMQPPSSNSPPCTSMHSTHSLGTHSLAPSESRQEIGIQEIAEPPGGLLDGQPSNSNVSAAAPATAEMVVAIYNVFKASYANVSDLIENFENAVMNTDMGVSWAMIVMAKFAASYQAEHPDLVQELARMFNALPQKRDQDNYNEEACRKEHEDLFAYALRTFLDLDKNEKGVDDTEILRMKLMDYITAQIDWTVQNSPSAEATTQHKKWKFMYRKQSHSSAKADDDAEFFDRMNQDIQRTVCNVFKHAVTYWLQPAESFVLFVRLSSAEWEGAFQVILQRLASDLSLQQKLGTYGFRFIQSSTSLPVATKERIASDQMPTVPLASRREVQLEPVLQPLEWSLFMTGIACAQDEMKVMEVIARLASRWYRRSAAGSAPQHAMSTYAEICRGIKLLSEVSTAKTATNAAGVCQVGGHGRLEHGRLELKGD